MHKVQGVFSGKRNQREQKEEKEKKIYRFGIVKLKTDGQRRNILCEKEGRRGWEEHIEKNRLGWTWEQGRERKNKRDSTKETPVVDKSSQCTVHSSPCARQTLNVSQCMQLYMFLCVWRRENSTYTSV